MSKCWVMLNGQLRFLGYECKVRAVGEVSSFSPVTLVHRRWTTGEPEAGQLRMVEKDPCSHWGCWQGTDDDRGVWSRNKDDKDHGNKLSDRSLMSDDVQKSGTHGRACGMWASDHSFSSCVAQAQQNLPEPQSPRQGNGSGSFLHVVL